MVSVCLASFNGEKYIKKQLMSILSQLSSDDEIIISDDGSTDSTLDIIRGINDKRIRLIEHKKNDISYRNVEGEKFYFVTRNFENALKNVKGDYIFLADQDDIWNKEKINICLEKLKSFDCVVHNYSVIDEYDSLIKEVQWKKNPLHKTPIANCMDSHFRGCCIAFRASFLKKILPIPRDVIGHDYWIGLIFSKYGSIYYEMLPLIQSRWYTDSVSAYRKNSLKYKIDFRVKLYKAFLVRCRKIRMSTEN